jgi:hypothetical protein
MHSLRSSSTDSGFNAVVDVSADVVLEAKEALSVHTGKGPTVCNNDRESNSLLLGITKSQKKGCGIEMRQENNDTNGTGCFEESGTPETSEAFTCEEEVGEISESGQVQEAGVASTYNTEGTGGKQPKLHIRYIGRFHIAKTILQSKWFYLVTFVQ